jgi:transposase-like protein
MAYHKAIKEQAKALYIAGVNVRMIAEELGIQRQETIWEWARKHKWKLSQSSNKIQTKTQIENKIVEKSVEVACEWIERQQKMAQLFQNKAVEAITQKDPKYIKVMEAVSLGREGADIERKALGFNKDEGINVFNSNVIIAWKGEGKLQAQ